MAVLELDGNWVRGLCVYVCHVVLQNYREIIVPWW